MLQILARLGLLRRRTIGSHMKYDEQKRKALVAKINAHAGLKILKSLHEFDAALKKHSIDLITAFGVFEYDGLANAINESSKAKEIRREIGNKHQLVPLWMSFSTGVECLVKSVLIKHDALEISIKNKTAKYKCLWNKASNYEASLQPYGFINAFIIDYTKEPLTAFEWRCIHKGVTHLYNLQIGTMEQAIQSLGRLQQRNIIDDDQRFCLANALKVLADIRRNIDAHTFHGLVVGSSINGDLEQLYLPAINLLLRL
jgi:hypothetical protein